MNSGRDAPTTPTENTPLVASKPSAGDEGKRRKDFPLIRPSSWVLLTVFVVVCAACFTVSAHTMWMSFFAASCTAPYDDVAKKLAADVKYGKKVDREATFAALLPHVRAEAADKGIDIDLVALKAKFMKSPYQLLDGDAGLTSWLRDVYGAAYDAGKVGYVPNQGNFGDALIACGAFKLLRAAGFSTWKNMALNEATHKPTVAQGSVLVYPGGDNLIPLWSTGIQDETTSYPSGQQASRNR